MVNASGMRPMPSRLDPERGDLIEWKSIVLAGLAAGAIFMVVQMALTAAEGSVWLAPAMIGAIVLGTGVLVLPVTFDLGVLLSGLIIHLILAVVFSVPLAALVQRRPPARAMGIGAFYGLVLYLINMHIFTGLFPWFATERGMQTLANHVLFGLVAGYLFVRLEAREERRSTGLRRTVHVFR